MPDRLSAIDASYLYLEDAATPMHVGGVAVFRKPKAGFDHARLVKLIEQRLPLVPRYRQRVAEVPGHLARPVWVDDPGFDVNYHVRRSALPRPGSDEQLHDLVARLMARPLDHTRPLWEAYLVEGLADGHAALITKTHLALVDGIRTIDFGQVILEPHPQADDQPDDEPWEPRRLPGPARLVLDAVTETVQRPREVVENVRAAVGDALATTQKVAGVLGTVVSAIGIAARPAQASPLNAPVGRARRYAVATAGLDDLRDVRARHGGTVNDVVLTVVAGALRSWLLSRGLQLTASSTVRALVPLAVRDSDGSVPGMLGNQVTPQLVDLPVGEPSPFVRLHHISHALRPHNDSVRSVAASALLRVGGFAPPTLHSLGARAAASFSQRIFNVVVTNVPGPQAPLYLGTARMTRMVPAMPLTRNQALAIGVTSYDGGVYFGLTGDRTAMADVDVLARMLEESVEELLTTVRA
ncbi:WS/DGAT/MGAT family O-acyltransferase [Actinokineospora globicatena]|uniref:WS/DGAT/MGAT family O-acyltransferase n=1 Tax=Actinokineospora globicatena TaxID=103729 RepID=UPI0020A2F02B|nr:wax ester/triacylglycerol synthase family O-acyltransferase [Actinokineospora globicatena]MCP2302127.1 acyltransferase, WS/DGAT/MGAT [Actinokineospora globicatena]GLW76211.1 diacylglycerol O-acyltransferase [Actinokineospora globicatena]GLW83047.1 diacylglycerol O-acyltransferase [Actinokineospora globicatena]